MRPPRRTAWRGDLTFLDSVCTTDCPIIDQPREVREEISTDPRPATTSTQASFSVLLTGYARQALASS